MSFFVSYTCKERLIILGAGWAGYKMIKSIDRSKYSVGLISPRNYFTFTPLLPSTSVGTLEFRSAIEPVRQSPELAFYEARCDGVDFDRKQIECTSALTGKSFQVAFDKLVIAVGAQSNTFNVPGVEEHANFLKDITDARSIRQKILRNLELASQPNISAEERKRHLHFVVVGGGPTGVEFCAELYDLVSDDLTKKYPALTDDIQISLIEAGPRILGSFDETLSSYATDVFTKRGIQVKLKQAVKSVHSKQLLLSSGEQIDYGLLVWNTGLRQNPLISSMNLEKEQRGMGRIVTDDHLRVYDADGKLNTDVVSYVIVIIAL